MRTPKPIRSAKAEVRDAEAANQRTGQPTASEPRPPEALAQIPNLPYRKFSTCGPPEQPTRSPCRTACRLETGDTADCKSAPEARAVSPSRRFTASVLCALALAPLVLAATDYTLDWDAVAPGSGTSTSGDGRFVLVDTLGQPDASVATNEVYRWDAGFVAGLNLPPQPGADFFQRATNRTAKVRLATLLANDSDPDADALTLTSLDAATAHGGTVTLDAGWVCYVPPADFNGADSFAYILTDAEGHRATNTVTIQMKGDAGGQTRNLVAIATLPNGHKLITVAGIAGRTNIIQWKADLGDPEWQSLPTPGVLGPNGLLEYEDTTEPAPLQRYYRTVTR